MGRGWTMAQGGTVVGARSNSHPEDVRTLTVEIVGALPFRRGLTAQ